MPLEYIKIMIEDALEAQRLTIHKEIVNLHMDMLRQFEQQKVCVPFIDIYVSSWSSCPLALCMVAAGH